MVIPYLCKKIFQIYFIGKWLFLILGTQRRSFTSERFLQIVGLVTHESAYSILFPSQNLQRCYKISISKFKLLFRFGQREGNNGPVFWSLIDTLLTLREKAVMELTKNPSLSKHAVWSASIRIYSDLKVPFVICPNCHLVMKFQVNRDNSRYTRPFTC